MSTLMISLDSLFDSQSIAVALDVMIKLGIGALLGGAIGLERELNGRPAGVRTHMLLVIGVVLFSEVSKGFGGGDSSRIAAQVVTGVGFLGAGTILRMGVEIKGLTSAASLWAASAIGMAVSVGGGYLLVAVLGTVLTLITLAYVSKLERRLVPHQQPSAMHVELADWTRMQPLIESIGRAGGKTKGMRVVSSLPLLVQLELVGDHDRLMEAASSVEGVRSSNWMEGEG